MFKIENENRRTVRNTKLFILKLAVLNALLEESLYNVEDTYRVIPPSDIVILVVAAPV